MTLSHKAKNAVHHLAKGYYEQAKYDEASTLFRFLTLMQPQNGTFWFGLASSVMMHGRYDEALQHFTIAKLYLQENSFEATQVVALQKKCNQMTR